MPPVNFRKIVCLALYSSPEDAPTKPNLPPPPTPGEKTPKLRTRYIVINILLLLLAALAFLAIPLILTPHHNRPINEWKHSIGLPAVISLLAIASKLLLSSPSQHRCVPKFRSGNSGTKRGREGDGGRRRRRDPSL